MKVAVLLFAFFATECYCGHAKNCNRSSDCGENEFCVDDFYHDYYYDGYCEVCPTNGGTECDSLDSWSAIQECRRICPVTGEYFQEIYPKFELKF